MKKVKEERECYKVIKVVNGKIIEIKRFKKNQAGLHAANTYANN